MKIRFSIRHWGSTDYGAEVEEAFNVRASGAIIAIED
jgi:hypothetical protein